MQGPKVMTLNLVDSSPSSTSSARKNNTTENVKSSDCSGENSNAVIVPLMSHLQPKGICFFK